MYLNIFRIFLLFNRKKVTYNITFFTLYLFPFIIYTTSQSIHAQESQSISGYIVSWKGDTIHGEIIPGDDFKNQKQVNFIDKHGVSVIYHPDRIAAYAFGDTSIYRSRPMPYLYAGLFAEERVFLKIIRSGPARLYRFYARRSVFTLKKGPGYFEILEKPDGSWHEVSLIFGWKHTAQVFDEYPDLANKIRNKAFNPEQMVEVVDIYNRWYLEQQR